MKILDYFNSTFLSKTLTNYVHYKHTSTNQLKECMKVAPELECHYKSQLQICTNIFIVEILS